MAEQPGRPVLILSDEMAISEGSGTNADDQVVLYGTGTARGESTPAPGQDVLLIDEGTAQTGPSQFLVNGEPIGYFETSESPEEFYNYTGGGTPHAQGLYNFGISDDPNTPTLYVYIHHSTSNDQFSLGIWYYGDGSDQYSNRVEIDGSAENFPNPGTPLVMDDPVSLGDEDESGTTADGDAYVAHETSGISNGDGAVWEIGEGTYELTFRYDQHTVSGREINQTRFRGPDGNLQKDLNWGDEVSFQITF